jgi:hypothetical protein
MVENTEIGKQRIQDLITDLRPSVSEFRWTYDGDTDTYLLRMTGGLRLRIDQSEVDEAADEPEQLPALRTRIEEAFRISESGPGIGIVTQVV